MPFVSILCLIRETATTKMSHQKAEPIKTPTTTVVAKLEVNCTFPLRAEKIAIKDKIVIGFSSVRMNVER